MFPEIEEHFVLQNAYPPARSLSWPNKLFQQLHSVFRKGIKDKVLNYVIICTLASAVGQKTSGGCLTFWLTSFVGVTPQWVTPMVQIHFLLK